MIVSVTERNAKRALFTRESVRRQRGVAPLRWGWLGPLSLVCAAGLLLMAIADTAARFGAAWAGNLFWPSLLIMFAPLTARLAWPHIARRESIWLVVVLSGGMYLVKVMHSPLAFTDHDEFFHWRTTNDILTTNHLFAHNPMLPVSALYPGLEIVTDAVISMSGLSIFHAGIIIVGIARLLFSLALYLFFERISSSAQVAGIASAIYMGNANYLFFDAMFKYETLALTFGMLVLYALAEREELPGTARRALTTVIVLALSAAVVTHHVTAYLLAAFVLLWRGTALLTQYWRREMQDAPGPGGMTNIHYLAVIESLAWLVITGRLAIDYLAPNVISATQEVVRIIAQEQSVGRQLFQDSGGTGTITPIWERWTGIASAGLAVLGIPFGLLALWRRYRASAVALALGLTALAYPASLALRFTGSGWEIGNRSSEFLFVALGFVLALAIVEIWSTPQTSAWRAISVVVCASILFMGGIIAGWDPAWRLPESAYIPDDGSRSIEPEGVTTAQWARLHLGSYNRVGADETNSLLMGSYGEQNVSSTISGGIDPAWILFAPAIEEDQRTLLQDGHLHYLVIDRRLAQVPHVARSYYPDVSMTQALAKFDSLAGAQRIYDSGDIQIYDLSVFSNDR